jgi:hypothetical protein
VSTHRPGAVRSRRQGYGKAEGSGGGCSPYQTTKDIVIELREFIDIATRVADASDEAHSYAALKRVLLPSLQGLSAEARERSCGLAY